MTDIVRIFETYATSQDWVFVYGNNYTHNILDASNFEPNKFYFFQDIPKRKNILSALTGAKSGVRYEGMFLLLKHSNLDKKYSERFSETIEPLLSVLDTFSNSFACSPCKVIQWEVYDVSNKKDYNMDGLTCTYAIEVPSDYTIE